MRVAFDATVLVDLFHQKPGGDRHAKIDELVTTLSKTKIIIPTPALAEILVGAGKNRANIYAQLSNSSVFEIAPFDGKAAIECSILLKDAWSPKEQRAITKTKLKFDWQILSIAVTRQVTTIYSDDKDIANAASRTNIKVIRISDLELPPSAKQGKLDIKL
jgi:predicted nucleic acid-binding protein